MSTQSSLFILLHLQLKQSNLLQSQMLIVGRANNGAAQNLWTFTPMAVWCPFTEMDWHEWAQFGVDTTVANLLLSTTWQALNCELIFPHLVWMYPVWKISGWCQCLLASFTVQKSLQAINSMVHFQHSLGQVEFELEFNWLVSFPVARNAFWFFSPTHSC